MSLIRLPSRSNIEKPSSTANGTGSRTALPSRQAINVHTSRSMPKPAAIPSRFEVQPLHAGNTGIPIGPTRLIVVTSIPP